MKRIYCTLLAIGFAAGLMAQQHKANYFNHLDLGVTVSSTGIGLDVSMPVGDYVRVRTGFTYMPKFRLKSSFPVEFNNQDVNETRMRRVTDMMYNLTGFSIDDRVDMTMQPTWGNFRFLVDVMPIPNNKHWNVTLGFYAGPSQIGKAYNVTEDAPTLMAVGLFNSLYTKAYMGEPLFQYEDSHGNMHYFDLGGAGELAERLAESGMVGMPLGKFPDGDHAMMVPDENSMARATMKVNKFRPYLGLGYTTSFSKDNKWKLAVDAGVLMWGGAPHVYVDNVYKTNYVQNGYDMVRFDTDTREFVKVQPQRIDLTRDVSGVQGKVGSMVRVAKRFKCYPVVGVTISRSLF